MGVKKFKYYFIKEDGTKKLGRTSANEYTHAVVIDDSVATCSSNLTRLNRELNYWSNYYKDKNVRLVELIKE